MFLEPHFRGQRSGWIEVICGSMFSGKTEELIRRLKRARFAQQHIEVFKPLIDTRYAVVEVVSHDTNIIDARPVAKSKHILQFVENQLTEGVVIEVVGIDEAQFFDMDLPNVCVQLAKKGVRVIAAGLDMDYRGVPFGAIPHLLAMAEYITKVHAICPHCGSLATHSYRKVASDEHVLLGEKESYEPRCRTCYDMGNMLALK
jgi:thymidine kinase